MGDLAWLRMGHPGGSACPTPVAHYRATVDTGGRRHGSVTPMPSASPPSGRYLAFTDREQIALWRAQGHGTGLRTWSSRRSSGSCGTRRGPYSPRSATCRRPSSSRPIMTVRRLRVGGPHVTSSSENRGGSLTGGHRRQPRLLRSRWLGAFAVVLDCLIVSASAGSSPVGVAPRRRSARSRRPAWPGSGRCGPPDRPRCSERQLADLPESTLPAPPPLRRPSLCALAGGRDNVESGSSDCQIVEVRPPRGE
jgi:hypothetical protein